MRLFSRSTKTDPADIGRGTAPTREQADRYAELRKGGATPLEATRAVRTEAAEPRRSRS